MKRFAVCLLFIFFIAGFALTAPAADEAKPSQDKSLSEQAQDVKNDAVKTYNYGKDAVMQDVKSIKEDFPKGLRDAKESAIQQTKDAKDSAVKEFKEIKDGVTGSKPSPKTENK